MKTANHFLVISATLAVTLAAFAESGSNAAKACVKLKAAVRVDGVGDRINYNAAKQLSPENLRNF